MILPQPTSTIHTKIKTNTKKIIYVELLAQRQIIRLRLSQSPILTLVPKSSFIREFLQTLVLMLMKSATLKCTVQALKLEMV
jgi:hypothetical protein